MDICLRPWGFKLVWPLYVLMIGEVGYIAIGTKIFFSLLVKTFKLAITMIAVERAICSRAYIACNIIKISFVIVIVIIHLLASLVKLQRQSKCI